jgi:hypothetical protein
MNDLKQEGAKGEYVRPQIAIMSDQEVLKAFQMTAADISAAGCWWMIDGGSGSTVPR